MIHLPYNPTQGWHSLTIHTDTMQSQLFITRVKKDDFGEYQCEAKNGGGENLSLPAFLTPKVSG